MVGFRALTAKGIGLIADDPQAASLRQKKKKKKETSKRLNLCSEFARVILILVPGCGHRMVLS